ncbi:MAG: undecaprenyl-diphosphate phosphatase [Alphaproteobacteria bacterium]
MFGLLVLQSIVQGVTEFLPVSSSGHLVLIWSAASWVGIGEEVTQAEMLTLNVALHVGTLAAVVIYFWRMVLSVARGGIDTLLMRETYDRRLFLFVVMASIPLMAAGLAVATFVPDAWLLNPLVVATATLVFGLVLLFADIGFASTRTAKDITFVDALVFGALQCLALIPGTSRSGITMTAGRLLSINRTDAARLSMVLSIPAIIAAGGYETYSTVSDGNWDLSRLALLGAGLAFISAMAAIWLFMRFIRVSDLLPFVIYRVVLALSIFAFVLVIGVSATPPI